MQVDGLADAERVPEQIDEARVVFPRRLAIALAEDLRQRTRGHIASEDVIEGRVVTESTVRVGTVGSKSARALEEGATILPRQGRVGKDDRPAALRFVIGGRVVYARRIVLERNRPGGKPFTRALRGRRKVVERTWEEVMDGNPG